MPVVVERCPPHLVLDQCFRVLRKRLLSQNIYHGSAACCLIEPVEVITRGIRTKPLDDRRIAASACFVNGALTYPGTVVLAAVSTRGAPPVVEVERRCMGVCSCPKR